MGVNIKKIGECTLYESDGGGYREDTQLERVNTRKTQTNRREKRGVLKHDNHEVTIGMKVMLKLILLNYGNNKHRSVTQMPCTQQQILCYGDQTSSVYEFTI